jgi:hypothetical protein
MGYHLDKRIDCNFFQQGGNEARVPRSRYRLAGSRRPVSICVVRKHVQRYLVCLFLKSDAVVFAMISFSRTIGRADELSGEGKKRFMMCLLPRGGYSPFESWPEAMRAVLAVWVS